MPLFSIITVTKNNESGLARTEASVKSQTFTDYEWVVIDGAAEPDNGIYDAMNKGISRAKGEYLIFMNAGDTFAAPDTLARIAEHTGPDFLYGDALEGEYLKPARQHIEQGMLTHHQAMVYRRGPLRYDTQYRIAADYKFTVEAIRLAKSFLYLPFPLCVFEQGGISQVKVEEGRREQSAIRRELGVRAPFIEAVQTLSHIVKARFPRLYWTLRSRRQHR